MAISLPSSICSAKLADLSSSLNKKPCITVKYLLTLIYLCRGPMSCFITLPLPFEKLLWHVGELLVALDPLSDAPMNFLSPPKNLIVEGDLGIR